MGKIWNAGEKEINQFYNNRNIRISANAIVELGDDATVFLLNKKSIRGQGLVQLKDGDSKEERYAQGRKQIYDWAQERYSDYEKHCEERESIRLNPVKPHQAILDFKKIIDDYEKWISEGSKVEAGLKEIVGEKKVTIYACPHCNKEFDIKVAYFGHLRSHEKEKTSVDTSSTGDKSKGEG